MFARSASAYESRPADRLQRAPLAQLRPGVVLAVVVVSVVGGAGIIQWDRRLVIIGLISGAVIMALNVVGVALRRWHRRNTQVGVAYADAEVVVRLRSPRKRLRSPQQLGPPSGRSS